MSELFFEILSGEIPAQMQDGAREHLKSYVEKYFQDQSVSFTQVQTFVTPRRLVAVVEGLPHEQLSRTEEKRGPRVACDAKALEGFLSAAGLKKQDLKIQETPKGQFYFANVIIEGKKTQDLVPQLIEQMISDFPWPKRMTWGTTQSSWIRPIYSILCLFDGKIVPHTLKLSGERDFQSVNISFSSSTFGHRFLSEGEISVSNFKDYSQKLLKGHVILDQDQRKKLILEQIQKLCDTHKLQWVHDENLLDEVVGLVEWPNLIMGRIDDRFMGLPSELLTTVMRVHQRYFALRDQQGNLAPYFIVAANTVTVDDNVKMIQGNERVLKARFEDGAFYYQLDQDLTLEEHALSLNKMMFHALLGSLADKTKRLENFVENLTSEQAISKDFKIAARLSKADLTCHLVAEFPELQGIIGSYYATLQGHSAAVSKALYEQYQPKGPNDSLPTSTTSKLLALADRLDSLVGFFSVGIKPTGSKDPFALRRSCLAVIRLLENEFDFVLEDLVTRIYEQYKHVLKDTKEHQDLITVLQDLENFFVDRLKVYWREQGYRHDAISAILSKNILKTPLRTLKQRLAALKDFLETSPATQDLLAAYKRAGNILKQGSSANHEFDVRKELMSSNEEIELFDALRTQEPIINEHFKNRCYTQALEELAPLRDKVDAFFEGVLVNDPNPEVRQNRLSLLGQFVSTLNQVADFSKIEGL